MSASDHRTHTPPDSGPVTLITPVDDELVDAFASSFEWAPVAGATSYRLQVAPDEDFLTLYVDADVGATTTLTMYDLLPMARGRLHWRVHAKVKGDWVSSPSEPFRAAMDYTERAVQRQSGPARATAQAVATGAAASAPAGTAVLPETGSHVAVDDSGSMMLVWIWVALTVAAGALIILKVMSGSV